LTDTRKRTGFVREEFTLTSNICAQGCQNRSKRNNVIGRLRPVRVWKRGIVALRVLLFQISNLLPRCSSVCPPAVYNCETNRKKNAKPAKEFTSHISLCFDDDSTMASFILPGPKLTWCRSTVHQEQEPKLSKKGGRSLEPVSPSSTRPY
jgi:hypothetical protein